MHQSLQTGDKCASAPESQSGIHTPSERPDEGDRPLVPPQKSPDNDTAIVGTAVNEGRYVRYSMPFTRKWLVTAP
jgi:hypothetical protein